jgi:hypothetical protein
MQLALVLVFQLVFESGVFVFPKGYGSGRGGNMHDGMGTKETGIPQITSSGPTLSLSSSLGAVMTSSSSFAVPSTLMFGFSGADTHLQCSVFFKQGRV